jgi:hypothetical protein
MALCHILPEAEGMYQALKLTKEHEAEELIHKNGGEDEHASEEEHDEHEEEEHSEDEEEHSDEEHDEHEEEGEHDEHADEVEGSHGFPLVYVLFFGGFMIMLSLDQVIFKPT